MLYFLLYLAIGIGLVSLCKTMDDRSMWSDSPVGASVLAVFWPWLVYHFIANVSVLRWRGKVIWTRK